MSRIALALTLLLLSSLPLIGCAQDSPEAVVRAFLQAAKRGDTTGMANLCVGQRQEMLRDPLLADALVKLVQLPDMAMDAEEATGDVALGGTTAFDFTFDIQSDRTILQDERAVVQATLNRQGRVVAREYTLINGGDGWRISDWADVREGSASMNP